LPNNHVNHLLFFLASSSSEILCISARAFRHSSTSGSSKDDHEC